MKRIIQFLSLCLLLNACTSQVDSSSQAAISTEACPKPTVAFLPKSNSKEIDSNQRFDYHIRNIVAAANKINFQTLKNDFVFCRGNNTWTVQPGTITSEFLPPKDYAAISENIINPHYKSINFEGKDYQYRVVIEPNFFLEEGGGLSRPNVAPENDKVVFELITPDSKKPQRQTLYTLKDLQQAAVKSGYSGTGGQLGIPRISAASVHGNKIWWAIAFEQGEGNNGIATIVGYEPQGEKFALIQPQEIWGQQITDLAITGDANNPTFWMGTNISGEGNQYIPASGLIAYRPDSQNLNSGGVTSYNVNNSPLVGAIPDKLRLEDDTLWVSTANGVCKLKWQAADNPANWSCWRFALMAKLPSEEVPLYASLTNKSPAVTLSPDSAREIEVLWQMPINLQTLQGRYEVRYLQGLTATVNEGAMLEPSNRLALSGKPPVFWTGFEWHWNGERFVRGFDEVANNEFGGGPRGIGSYNVEPNVQSNWKAIRGDFDLLKLTPKSTTVKYYSGWVDQDKLNPYLTVVPQEQVTDPQPNPLISIAEQLQSR